jgi:hypothetical protein
MREIPRTPETALKRRVVIELGGGSMTIPRVYNRNLLDGKAGNVYINVDRDFWKAKKSTEDIATSSNKVLAINADAMQLPLQEEAVEEVIMHNLIDEHGEEDRLPEMLPRIIPEIYRVLKNGGTLTIIEDMVVSEEVRLDKEILVEELKRSGFSIRTITTATDPDFNDIVKPYFDDLGRELVAIESDTESFPSKSYVIIAEK